MEDKCMEMGEIFEKYIWRQMKSQAMELSKKEIAKEFFIAGYSLAEEQFNSLAEETLKEFQENPKEFEKEFNKLKGGD